MQTNANNLVASYLSDSCTKGSSNFEIVVDLSSFGLGVAHHFRVNSLLTHSLNVNLLEIVEINSFTLRGGHCGLFSSSKIVNSLDGRVLLIVVSLGVSFPEEGIVALVSLELDGVHVVSEKSVMSVEEVSHASSEVPVVLNGGLVVVGSSDPVLEVNDHELFKNLVSHSELLASSRDVSVVMHDSHVRETSDVHLDSHVFGQISLGLGLLLQILRCFSILRKVVPEGQSDGMTNPNDTIQ